MLLCSFKLKKKKAKQVVEYVPHRDGYENTTLRAAFTLRRNVLHDRPFIYVENHNLD